MCYCLLRNVQCNSKGCSEAFDVYANETPQNAIYDYSCPKCNKEYSFVVQGTGTYDPVNQISPDVAIAIRRNIG